MHDFRGVTLADINRRIIPILKKKPDVIILHIRAKYSVYKTLRKIFDDLLQLKKVVTKALSHYKVFFLQATVRLDNGKVTLTLHHLNEHF